VTFFLLVSVLQASDYLGPADLAGFLQSKVETLGACPRLPDGSYSLQVNIDSSSQLLSLEVADMDGNDLPFPCWEEVLREEPFPPHSEEELHVLWRLTVQDGVLYALPGLKLMQRNPALPGLFFGTWGPKERSEVLQWLHSADTPFPLDVHPESEESLEMKMKE
jgi:hypothetical protein